MAKFVIAAWRRYHICIGSSCYFVTGYRSSSEEAEYNCIKYGGHLVSFNSEQELDEVVNFTQSIRVKKYFIGLTREAHADSNKSENWVWASGEEGNPLKENILNWRRPYPKIKDKYAAGAILRSGKVIQDSIYNRRRKKAMVAVCEIANLKPNVNEEIYRVDCGDGHFIPKTQLCDDIQNCINGIDESPITCPEKHKNACTDKEFKCANSKQCVPLANRCDGNSDCKNSADENDCPNNDCQSKGKIDCGDGFCHTLEQLCDGHQDCFNNQDEKHSTRKE